MNEESWLPEIAALPLTGTQFTRFTNTKVQILTPNGRAAAYRSGLRHQLGLLVQNFLLYSHRSTHIDAAAARSLVASEDVPRFLYEGSSITAVSPDFAPTTGGTLLTLYANDFGAKTGPLEVSKAASS